MIGRSDNVIPLSIILAMSLASSAAIAADPPPAATAPTPAASRAEALFQEGKTLLEQGSFTEACDRLAQSDTIDPTISTLGLLAGCHEQQGRIATAWKEYRDTVKRAEAAGDSRADFARERATALEPRVPKIAVRIAHPAPSTEVFLALSRLTATELAGEIPVDPGAYEIIVRAPQKRELRLTVTVKEGARRVIDVPDLVAPDGPPYPSFDAPAAKPEPAPAPTVVMAAPPPPPSGMSTRTAAALVAGGVAVVGVGVGAAFGASAMSKNNTSTTIAASCTTPAQCDKGRDLRDGAFKAATISSVSFGVSAVGTVMALVLVLLPKSSSEGADKPASARNLWIAPQIGATEGGATVMGRF